MDTLKEVHFFVDQLPDVTKNVLKNECCLYILKNQMRVSYFRRNHYMVM